MAALNQGFTTPAMPGEAAVATGDLLQGVIDALASHIAVLEADGTILLVNRAWRHFAAANGMRDAQGGIGTNYLSASDQASALDRSAASAAAGIRDVIQGRQAAFQMEYPCHGPEEQRWFQMRVTAMEGAAPRRVTVVHDNVTARVLAAQRQHAAEQHLARSGRLTSVAAMASGIAHELNQPLTALNNYLHLAGLLLQRDPRAEASAPLRQALEQAGAQALRAGEIIRRLRAFIGRGAQRQEATDIAALLRECLLLLQATGLTTRCEPELQLPEQLGSLTLDRIQMQQAVFNLLRNAVEALAAHPAPRLRIEGWRDQDRLGITVADNGPGLPAAVQAQLFEPMATTKADGSGLGLIISRTIVEAHGGTLTAAAGALGGACFTILLPIAGSGRDDPA